MNAFRTNCNPFFALLHFVIRSRGSGCIRKTTYHFGLWLNFLLSFFQIYLWLAPSLIYAFEAENISKIRFDKVVNFI